MANDPVRFKISTAIDDSITYIRYSIKTTTEATANEYVVYLLVFKYLLGPEYTPHIFAIPLKLESTKILNAIKINDSVAIADVELPNNAIAPFIK